ncbi:unnamed protein product [Durusdinium trenchii]|uniref:Transmembrane protein n=2 Tax=Durusdinium trenchii TaxID=1381693 RepID=A0ABP0PML9_9DINO
MFKHPMPLRVSATMRSRPLKCLELLACAACVCVWWAKHGVAFTSGPAHGSLRCRSSARVPEPIRGDQVLRRAEEERLKRRDFFASVASTPPSALGTLAVLFGATVFVLTREEKVRKAKICPRSWQQIDDFMADPEKTKRLHEQKGVPYEAMRDYLQDPTCISLSEYVDRLKTAKSVWEAGEEYRVG